MNVILYFVDALTMQLVKTRKDRMSARVNLVTMATATNAQVTVSSYNPQYVVL